MNYVINNERDEAENKKPKSSEDIVGLQGFNSIMGFSGKFQDNLKEATLAHDELNKVQDITTAPLGRIVLRQDKSFSPLQEFSDSISSWLRVVQEDLRKESDSYLSLFFNKSDLDPIFFFSLATMNLKGNLLKKEVSDFFRRTYPEGRELIIPDKYDSKLILEFSSSKSYLSKISGAEVFMEDLNGFVFTDGVLRWRLTQLESGQASHKLCSTHLQDNQVFMESISLLSENSKNAIFEYETIRYLINRYNGFLKNLFQQGLDYVINKGKMSQFQAGIKA